MRTTATLYGEGAAMPTPADRLPPHNLEVERLCLGAMILHNRAVAEVVKRSLKAAGRSARGSWARIEHSRRLGLRVDRGFDHAGRANYIYTDSHVENLRWSKARFDQFPDHRVRGPLPNPPE